ncbi:hypothetical protein LCGC14_1237570 [marine sediment metagenome]|uniref:Uncharacterized protein n=1 Tax=marine sediment metagenome TaxID=412755 RepID=A0A0F9L6U5_9ZZZZ
MIEIGEKKKADKLYKVSLLGSENVGKKTFANNLDISPQPLCL